MTEIARLAGVHQTTVSRALRNDRRLPDATRERIQGVAREAGYRPNPLVSALVALRRSRHRARYQATLAFVANRTLDEAGGRHFAAGQAMAEQLGYKLDLFIIGQSGLAADRLDHMLAARGIHGIVIAPLPDAHSACHLTWERYCTVAIEYTFTFPAFDRVLHDSYGGMRTIMQECHRRRLRRVGLTLSTGGSERTEELNSAAFWIEQKTGRFFSPIPPLIQPAWNTATFTRWFERHRVNALVTSNALLGDFAAWCKTRRLEAGSDVHLINVNVLAGGRISGITQNHAEIGATAVRLAIDKLTHNDRGIPAVRHTTLTPGSWHEGMSLRAASSRRAAQPSLRGGPGHRLAAITEPAPAEPAG
jgi:LacI family transcriptional regulator/LacI family fructose operon transcriptional repressor